MLLSFQVYMNSINSGGSQPVSISNQAGEELISFDYLFDPNAMCPNPT